MATASSVQREPSMEEILASIRRIIEDSDSGRKPAEAFAQAGDEAGIPDEPAPAVVDVFRNELRSGPQPVPLEAPANVDAPKQAEVAPAHQPEAVVADSKTDEHPSASSSFKRIDFTRTDLSNPAVPASEKPATKSDDWLVPLDVGSVDKGRHSGHSENRPADPVSSASLHSVQDIQGEEASAMQAKAEPAPLPSTPSAAEAHDVAAPKPALVSEKTSRQVAAAFGELSDAFAARSKKSLDEMAEEMLRPMLQDWLDNNLPTLVERLVREEIERVARGA